MKMHAAGSVWFKFGLVVTLLASALYYLVWVAPYSNQRLLTVNLPPIDRVQIEAVDSQGSEEVKVILASRDLAGTDAQSFANLWRSQWYGYSKEDQVFCHNPAYRVRFFDKNTLLLEATVCFKCMNIYFLKSDLVNDKNLFTVVFSSGPSSDKFRTYLSRLFPGHDKEASLL